MAVGWALVGAAMCASQGRDTRYWCTTGVSAPVYSLAASGARVCCAPECGTCGGEGCSGSCCTTKYMQRGPRCKQPTDTSCVYYEGVGDWVVDRLVSALNPATAEDKGKALAVLGDLRRHPGPGSRRAAYKLFSVPQPTAPLKCRSLNPRRPLVPAADPPTPQVSFEGSRCEFPVGASGNGQSREDIALYYRYFCGVCKGTFVELGAIDGTATSNTLLFEEALGWTGVLVEANPNSAALLHKNARRSKSTRYGPMAVCPAGGTQEVLFSGLNRVGQGHVVPLSYRGRRAYADAIPIPCKPIGELIRSAGISSVDLFSLDVEGAELEVLQTMDWSIPVRVFIIEMMPGNPAKNLAVRKLLLKNGYRRARWDPSAFCCPDCWCAPNEVFEHRRLIVDATDISA
eukprot:TRINITY_DN32643_c0_g1_i1.p1 TRINITY_DN32643_c0_g1~~TRINITY_DN32643_c0_g1_i1.p1  ORF type:complete len:401 (+),score=74.89 TRINITY_DN32643_c0_g1_i1:78-1280(+)